MRYVITGGDNGYCCKCGGLCDRALLEIDDEHKTYRGINGCDICLGKWCWRILPVGNGWFLKKYAKFKGEEVESWGGNIIKLVYIDDNGDELASEKVVVKNNKWGKDGEFKTWRNGKIVWDKIQQYKFLGWGELEKK